MTNRKVDTLIMTNAPYIHYIMLKYFFNGACCGNLISTRSGILDRYFLSSLPIADDYIIKWEKHLTNSWLRICGKKNRLAALPDECRGAVEIGVESNWGNTWIRTAKVKKSLTSTVEKGAPLPDDVKKTLGATLRALDDNNDLAKNPEEIVNFLSKKPHLIVLIYEKYGLEALEVWPQRRNHGKKQRKWNHEKKIAVADKCWDRFGGVPNHHYLRNAGDSELSALVQHTPSRSALDQFAKEFDLPRLDGKAPNGFWEGDEGSEVCRRAYAKFCLIKNRYVSDYELSQMQENVAVEGYPRFLWASNVREVVKKNNESVRGLFLELMDNGELPEQWRNQTEIPTANDGTLLDSYSEVRWYEAWKKAAESLPGNHDAKKNTVVVQPFIGKTHYRADFCINSVYIEVLRHPMCRIKNPLTNDEQNYSEKIKRRMNAYEVEGMTVKFVDPEQLSDEEMLTRHLEEVIELVGKEKTSINKVVPSSIRPPGYWRIKENRDKAVRECMAVNMGGSKMEKSGVYPSHNELAREGYGGLVGALKYGSRKGTIDRQEEALRVGAFAVKTFTEKTSPIRKPTSQEILQVIEYHMTRLGRVNCFSKKEMCFLFGTKMCRDIVDELGSMEVVAERMRSF